MSELKWVGGWGWGRVNCSAEREGAVHKIPERGEDDFCCKFSETLPIGRKTNVVSVPLLGTRDSSEMRF